MTDDEIRAELAAARAAGRNWRVSVCERALGMGGPLDEVLTPETAREMLALGAELGAMTPEQIQAHDWQSEVLCGIADDELA